MILEERYEVEKCNISFFRELSKNLEIYRKKFKVIFFFFLIFNYHTKKKFSSIISHHVYIYSHHIVWSHSLKNIKNFWAHKIFHERKIRNENLLLLSHTSSLYCYIPPRLFKTFLALCIICVYLHVADIIMEHYSILWYGRRLWREKWKTWKNSASRYRTTAGVVTMHDFLLLWLSLLINNAQL